MKNGDEAAINEFVEKFYPQVLRYCRLHISDPQDAEDIAQECFERFFRNFRSYKSYGKSGAYLCAIAGNLCKDYYRKMKEIPLSELPEEAASPDYDSRLYVYEAINSLPEDIRETAILFFVQELKQRDIAKILCISSSLVKYRIKRARELISKYLETE